MSRKPIFNVSKNISHVETSITGVLSTSYKCRTTLFTFSTKLISFRYPKTKSSTTLFQLKPTLNSILEKLTNYSRYNNNQTFIRWNFYVQFGSWGKLWLKKMSRLIFTQKTRKFSISVKSRQFTWIYVISRENRGIAEKWVTGDGYEPCNYWIWNYT